MSGAAPFPATAAGADRRRREIARHEAAIAAVLADIGAHEEEVARLRACLDRAERASRDARRMLELARAALADERSGRLPGAEAS